jgi:hypothetical protein
LPTPAAILRAGATHCQTRISAPQLSCSLIPSEKKSWFGSPEMFSNGRTASAGPPGLAQSFAGEASIRLRGCAFRSIVRLAATADTASATNRAPTQRTDVICSSHSDGAAAIPWKSRRARFKPALASWVAFMRDPDEARCCGAAGAGRRGTGHQKVPAGGTRRRQKRNPHTSVDPLCRGGPPFAVKRGRLR